MVATESGSCYHPDVREPRKSLLEPVLFGRPGTSVMTVRGMESIETAQTMSSQAWAPAASAGGRK